LLVETVKEEAKPYCDLQEDLAIVKLEMADSIFSDLLNDLIVDLTEVPAEGESVIISVQQDNSANFAMEVFLERNEMQEITEQELTDTMECSVAAAPRRRHRR
jgi:translation initiation factor 6 (eIF-6)